MGIVIAAVVFIICICILLIVVWVYACFKALAKHPPEDGPEEGERFVARRARSTPQKKDFLTTEEVLQIIQWTRDFLIETQKNGNVQNLDSLQEAIQILKQFKESCTTKVKAQNDELVQSQTMTDSLVESRQEKTDHDSRNSFEKVASSNVLGNSFASKERIIQEDSDDSYSYTEELNIKFSITPPVERRAFVDLPKVFKTRDA